MRRKFLTLQCQLGPFECKGCERLHSTYATEINLTGHFDTAGLKHTLLIGGDYYRNDLTLNSIGATTADGTGIPIINFRKPNFPGSSRIIPDLSQLFKVELEVDNFGFYLQDQIELPYNLHVLGGIRYQYIHQKNVAFDSTSSSLVADDVTPRVGLLWQPQEWLSLYGNYVENFGPNTGVVFPNESAPPSSALQWEFGTKAEFFDGRLRATVAYFDLTKQNVVTPDPDLTHVCGGGSCTLVAGEVVSRGVEFDIQGEILPGWNIIANYANQDVRITKSNNGDEGFRFSNTPRNIGSLWSTYDFQGGLLQGLKIGGGVTFRDRETDISNTVDSPGYGIVDLLAAYSFAVGKSSVTAQLNVNNLLDKNTFVTRSAIPDLNTALGSYVTPRSFLGSIRVEF